MNIDKPSSLLLVEDDPNDAVFFRRGLAQAGIAGCQVARDGQEALAYLEGRGSYADRALHPVPTLMVLDLKLPRISGLEVLEWVRHDPRWKDLPVIILTSSKEPSDVARAQELGIVAYHVKPVDYSELTELVKSIGFQWIKLAKDSVVPGGAA